MCKHKNHFAIENCFLTPTLRRGTSALHLTSLLSLAWNTVFSVILLMMIFIMSPAFHFCLSCHSYCLHYTLQTHSVSPWWCSSICTSFQSYVPLCPPSEPSWQFSSWIALKLLIAINDNWGITKEFLLSPSSNLDQSLSLSELELSEHCPSSHALSTKSQLQNQICSISYYIL